MKGLLIFAILALSGCTTTGYISAGVSAYCSASVESRLTLRIAVAAAISPNRIQVFCDGDP